MKVEHNYGSPRWTSEVRDCSMPMTLDTYSLCSYQCQYCFAYFQKVHCLKGMHDNSVVLRAANPDHIERMFRSALGYGGKSPTKGGQQFAEYIKQRNIIQWGALSDPFDQYERKHGATLKLMEFFDKIDYPISFSTKGTWWTEDARYMDLMARHTHNWHVKVSIITNDEKKARVIEHLVPTPKARLAAIGRLSSIGVHTTLRLRPYIIGASEGAPQLINDAADQGADSVSTEFFCMETRADKPILDRYRKMSKVLGYDVVKFYRAQSSQPGYKRLNRAIKLPIFTEMRDAAHRRGMRFHVSDAHCRELNDAVNCCGVPPEWKTHKGHFGQAILVAKERGTVRWADIAHDVESIYAFSWSHAAGFNSKSSGERAKYLHKTMADYVKNSWNNINSWTGPFRCYGGILHPCGKDAEGNIVYSYRGANDGGACPKERTQALPASFTEPPPTGEAGLRPSTRPVPTVRRQPVRAHRSTGGE